MMPEFLPRLIISVCMPAHSCTPWVTSFMPKTPIEPVMVPGSAKIFLQGMAM